MLGLEALYDRLSPQISVPVGTLPIELVQIRYFTDFVDIDSWIFRYDFNMTFHQLAVRVGIHRSDKPDSSKSFFMLYPIVLE